MFLELMSASSGLVIYEMCMLAQYYRVKYTCLTHCITQLLLYYYHDLLSDLQYFSASYYFFLFFSPFRQYALCLLSIFKNGSFFFSSVPIDFFDVML